jgi:hypothetical protein
MEKLTNSLIKRQRINSRSWRGLNKMADTPNTTQTQPIDYDALAKQAVSSTVAKQPSAPKSEWVPKHGDPVAHVQTSDGQEYHVHGDDLAELQKRDPNLKVIAPPSPHKPDYDALAKQAGANPAASTPGAYQQFKGGPIQNANEEAANPFSESTTSPLGNVLGTKPTGAMTKREGESDSQFMARAIEAGKRVTSEQIEEEKRGNNARTVPTLVGAALSGPAMLTAEMGSVFGAEKLAQLSKPIAQAILKHVAGPGNILKFPYGRAVEYYMLGKLGLSKSHISEIASHLP